MSDNMCCPMCGSHFLIPTSVGFGIGTLVMVRYLVRLGYKKPENEKKHVMITFTSLLLVIACLGLHMASSCPKVFVTWGQVCTALLGYLFLAECCRLCCPYSIT